MKHTIAGIKKDTIIFLYFDKECNCYEMAAKFEGSKNIKNINNLIKRCSAGIFSRIKEQKQLNIK